MKKVSVALCILYSCFFSFAEERSYTIYMMGNKIGKSIEKWEERQDSSGKCNLKLDSSSNMEISRGSFAITLNSRSVVFADCKTFKPVSVQSESSEISSKVNSKGTVESGVFHAEIEKNNNKEFFSYPVVDDLTFFSFIFKKFSQEQLLKGGKTNVISEESLSIKEITFSAIKEPSGNIVTTVNYGGIPITFTLSKGVVVKSELQNGLITYNLDGYDSGTVTPSTQSSKSDIISATALENSGIPIKKPRKTKKVIYLFKSKNNSAIPAIPESCFQKVSITDQSASVTNTALQCSGDNIDKVDTSSNLYEDSNNISIINTAKKIADGAPDKNEIIRRMVKFVFRHIKDKNYKFGNLSASEVLAKQSGDCTEHSTLLSALLKSLNIPVKMAYGLVLDNEGKFFFHNWNVVYGNSGWISVDSTFGMEKADSSRIILIYGGGSSKSREDVSITVLKFINNIDISVTGFEYE